MRPIKNTYICYNFFSHICDYVCSFLYVLKIVRYEQEVQTFADTYLKKKCTSNLQGGKHLDFFSNYVGRKLLKSDYFFTSIKSPIKPVFLT